jgi:3-dehydroquinate synthase
MTVVKVDLGARSYDVRIDDGLLDRAHEPLASFARDGRLVVVSDENVWAAQGARLQRGLAPI